mmetsp:Transcript_80311/g.184009  ORF Transcript_80311/g.184009 Transcript_80311/m.184009 type:complete len:108 (+) Transcript_80311:328-651(+)
MSRYEALTLFFLVDLDGSGTIDIDEFIFGVIRVRGGAKSIDMVSMMYDVHRISNVVHKLSDEVGLLVEKKFGKAREPELPSRPSMKMLAVHGKTPSKGSAKGGKRRK